MNKNLPQKLLCIFCFFLLNTSAQHVTIKVAKDTSFQIKDFISFSEKDTTETFSFIRQKYFSTSKVLTGLIQKNCTDKADNPPYTIVGANFRIDFCLENSGRIYSLELTAINQKYLNENIIVQQLKDLGYTPAYPHKEKKITATEYRLADKAYRGQDKCVTISVRKEKILKISFESKPTLPGLKRQAPKKVNK